MQCLMSIITDQLKLYPQVQELPGTFFDHVIFSSNVTYVDGGFKGGELFSYLNLVYNH